MDKNKFHVGGRTLVGTPWGRPLIVAPVVLRRVVRRRALLPRLPQATNARAARRVSVVGRAMVACPRPTIVPPSRYEPARLRLRACQIAWVVRKTTALIGRSSSLRVPVTVGDIYTARGPRLLKFNWVLVTPLHTALPKYYMENGKG